MAVKKGLNAGIDALQQARKICVDKRLELRANECVDPLSIHINDNVGHNLPNWVVWNADFEIDFGVARQ